MKILNCNFFFSSIFSLFWVSCLVFSWKYFFSYLCFFLMLSYVFVQHHCFWFQKTQVEKHFFFRNMGVQHNVFFINLCFAKCEKLSFWGGIFCKFLVVFQKHYKKRHFSTFFKANIYKTNDIFGSYYLVQVGSYYLVQVGCVLKNANLDQILTSNFLARNLFSKKMCWNPSFL